MEYYLLTHSECNGESCNIVKRSLHRGIDGAMESTTFERDQWVDSIMDGVLLQVRTGHFGTTLWEIRQLTLED